MMEPLGRGWASLNRWSDGKSRRAWELRTVCCNKLATTGLTPLWHEIPGACELLAEDRIAYWNPQYGGAPSAFCEVGVQEEFGHNLVSCGLIWLTGFMGQPLFALGLICVPETSCLWKRVPVPTAIFFINFQNMNWRAQPKSTKKSMQV